METLKKNAAEDWRDADAKARACENQLREAWARYHSRRGPPPTEEMKAEAARLRSVATDRLISAIIRNSR